MSDRADLAIRGAIVISDGAYPRDVLIREGRISALKRRHGLDRCRYHGDNGMERWVGWGVIAHDLRVIAQHQVAKTTCQR